MAVDFAWNQRYVHMAHAPHIELESILWNRDAHERGIFIFIFCLLLVLLWCPIRREQKARAERARCETF